MFSVCCFFVVSFDRLLVVGCVFLCWSLCVNRCSLFVVGCYVFVVGCSLFFFLFVVLYSLFVVCCWLLDVVIGMCFEGRC